MPVVPLPFPRRGITEAFAFSQQPPETSYDEQNVRVRHPKTGRLSGGQRAGYSTWNASQIQASKIQAMASVQVDNPNVTFANKSTGLDSTDTVATVDTPSGGDCYDATMDRVGNIYALDGKAGMVKYNPDLIEQYRLSFPTANPDDVVRTIAVDSFLSIYAAVSDGTKQEDASVFCYIPDIASNALLLWTFKPGGFVKKIKERNGVLYGIVDKPDVQKSELFAITDIDVPNPTTILRQEIPYPVSDFDIGPDGSIFIAHLAVPDVTLPRGHNPKAPDADPVFESWTPRDYSDYSSKIWSWHDAQNIDGQFNAALNDNDEIYAWYDQSGNNRHYYAAIDESLAPTTSGTAVPITAPTYTSKAQAGLPGVSFNGSSNLMRSQPNDSTSFAYRDSQKTGVPAFRPALDSSGVAIAETDCAWLMFLCVRVDPEEEGSVARYLWSHEDADVGGTDGDRHIYVNRSDGAADSSISSTDRARISIWEGTHGPSGNGTGNQPASGNAEGDYGLDDGGSTPAYGDALDNTSGILILTYLCDGNFQSGTFSDSTTHSLVRINGRPIDRYQSLPAHSLKSDYLGGTGIADADLDTGGTGTVNRFFRGQILERIVFHRGEIDTSSPTTEPIIAAHQEFGNAAASTNCEAWPGVGVDQGDNLITQVEGYLGNRWGKKSVLPKHATGGNNTKYPHPYSSLVPLAPSEQSGFSVQSQQSSNSFTSKWSGDSGLHLWTFGFGGFDVAVDLDSQVYTYGQESASNIFVRAHPDGTTPGTQVWFDQLGFSGGTGTFDDNYPRLTLDTKNNLYVAVAATPSGTGPDGDVIVFAQDGTQLNDWDRDTDQWITYRALPGIVPSYPDTVTNQRAQYFYAFGKDTDENSDDLDNIAKVEIVSQAPNTDPPRTRYDIAIAGGNVRLVTTSSNDIVTNGTTALGASARYIEALPFKEQIFLIDGSSYKYYDPAVGTNGTVSAWTSTSGGEIPPRCRIMTRWNGRLLLGRGDDPTDFFMSKKADAFNWDFIPPVASPDQAIRVSDSRLGAVPDIVTALIPLSDDILLIGGDHSIHRMVGEPLLGGSSYDLMSGEVGIAWNSSWARDRAGNTYVMDSQGGILQISGQGGITDLTRDAIDERLRTINLSTYYAKLVWSERFRGLHVYLMPFGSGGTIVEHYFWEEQVQAWHPDKFFRTEEQPTAAMVLDGDDPDDRLVLIGTEDGYILKEDPDANNDAAQLIDSYVRMGPIGSPGAAVRGSRFEFLLSDAYAGATVGLYGSDEPDVFGKPRHEFDLEPGRNGRVNQKIKAASLWVQLRNATPGETWAYESGSMMLSDAGRLKPRPRENTVGL